MIIWKPVSYKHNGLKKQIPEQVLDNAIEFYNRFQSKSIPCILTLKHLSQLIKIPFKEIYKFTYNQRYLYRVFTIRKRSGGTRTIYSPRYNLLRVQQWINNQILQKDSSISQYTFAFRKGYSIKDCAQVHCGCNWLIKIDIQNYFESISEIDVYNYFHNLGYPKLLSFHLARICTVCDKKNKQINFFWKVFKNHTYKILPQQNIGFLPQGAATSPMLANLISKELDNEIHSFLKSLNNQITFHYSRYADDIFISTNDITCNLEIARKVLNTVKQIIYNHGFTPNLKKCKIIRPGKKKTVLGLVVNSTEPKLTRHFKNNLECHLYYFNKNKIYHSQFCKFKTIFGTTAYIKGLLSYARQIDQKYVENLQKKIGFDDKLFII